MSEHARDFRAVAPTLSNLYNVSSGSNFIMQLVTLQMS